MLRKDLRMEAGRLPAGESVGDQEGAAGREAPRAVLFFERTLAAPRRRIMGIPTAFQGFPPPGLSPGGRGEPQVVAPHVMEPVPDLQPALEQERLESTPSAGRDGGSIRAVWEAGISVVGTCASAGSCVSYGPIPASALGDEKISRAIVLKSRLGPR